MFIIFFKDMSKSIYGERFNHDPIADVYDDSISDETNPIRTGYGDMMKWVTDTTDKSETVLDLGCGTGNTSLPLGHAKEIYAVDISENMLILAKQKLQGRDITFVQDDLLHFVTTTKLRFDAVVSTYAMHHFVEEEKMILLENIYSLLEEGGIFVLGDLMFHDGEYEQEMRKKYPGLKEDFDEEFFWNVKSTVMAMQRIGFEVSSVKKFSDLSWGILAIKS